MPKNKDALIRYRIIDGILRNKHKAYPSMEDIIDTLERKLDKTFSKSTVQKDIKAMREDSDLGFHAPIGYSRQHDGYYYTDTNFTIASVPLNEDDIEAIDFAAILLEQFKEVPIFAQYANAVDKIMEAVNIRRVIGDYKEDSIIQFEQVPYQQGTELLNVLISAIKSRNIITFDYIRFDQDEPKHHRVHPYLLKEFRNRWYLIGMSENNKGVLTFGIDRIADLHITDEALRLHPDFIPEKYFKYSYGIFTHDGEPQDIILSFTPFIGKYIKSQPLHSSQKILKDNKEELQVSIKVWPTPELTMQILGYGPGVKVLAPQSFSEELQKSLRETLKKYTD